MAALLFGSLLLGMTGRLTGSAQIRLAVAASLVATLAYYVSQRAM